MNYTYLLVNLGLLLFSGLVFSNRQINFAGQSKFIILAVLINVFAFSVPTEFLTQLKVIVFNPPYLSGMTLWELPIEELLLSLLLPLSGIAIYLFLNMRYKDNSLEKYSLALSNMLLGVCIAMLYFGHQKLYTLFTFSILLVFLLYIEYVNKIRFMYKFYRAFLVSLLLFYTVYGILTSIPVIQYTTEETLNFNFSHIPFESHFYYMSMLLLSIYLYELFKSRARN
ncbi:lycopene cyclase domain-containing protein [Pedobacter sp. MC2016-15]|uniref:lycopene cyclase domain-containing protein n=1 Tax=Pedobacter sp. MC2016-15 TaxID=2994473 RepID=UPI002247DF21|nr:lycopene cyclase domain-containing protein [Pedobacter sp. MC2016-15]MCX2481317.1 lycopene cyclase domain-containing protein [Pedobacter sp. MC2016-15]